MFVAMAGHDPRDPTSLDAAPANAAKALGGEVRGLRVGRDRDYAFKGIDAGEARALEAALKVLERQERRSSTCERPTSRDTPQYWSVICGHEMAAAHAATFPARAAEYGPYLRAMLAGGAAVTPEQLAAARRRQAALTAQLANCSRQSTSSPGRGATARPGRSPTPCRSGRSPTKSRPAPDLGPELPLRHYRPLPRSEGGLNSRWTDVA